MAGENRTPDKKIGEIAHAEEQAERTTGHKPAPGPEQDDTPRVYPDRDPSKKKTGEF